MITNRSELVIAYHSHCSFHNPQLSTRRGREVGLLKCTLVFTTHALLAGAAVLLRRLQVPVERGGAVPRAGDAVPAGLRARAVRHRGLVGRAALRAVVRQEEKEALDLVHGRVHARVHAQRARQPRLVLDAQQLDVLVPQDGVLRTTGKSETFRQK